MKYLNEKQDDFDGDIRDTLTKMIKIFAKVKHEMELDTLLDLLKKEAEEAPLGVPQSSELRGNDN